MQKVSEFFIKEKIGSGINDSMLDIEVWTHPTSKEVFRHMGTSRLPGSKAPLQFGREIYL